MLRLVASVGAVSAVVSSRALTGADAQAARDIVGTWALVSAAAQPGGVRTDVFGGDGRYVLAFLRSDMPKFASNNRPSGTADENKAVVLRSTAHFGTYTADEAGKALASRIEGSTFPNWTGAEQRRAPALSGDELTYIAPGSAGAATQVTMRRVK